jgi:hypothetical protein
MLLPQCVDGCSVMLLGLLTPSPLGAVIADQVVIAGLVAEIGGRHFACIASA